MRRFLSLIRAFFGSYLTGHQLSCVSERYDQSDSGAWVSLLCEGYKLTGSFTLQEIADFIRSQSSHHPGHILFATLDDVRQAAYTCGHSTDKNRLDDIEGHDLSALPPSVFEEFDGEREHQGYLTLTEEFPIRHKNFMRKASEEHASNLKGCLEWFDGEYGATVMTNADLPTIAREDTSFVQIVPVKTAPEALASFPNGYFSEDLSPFQNYALCKTIEDRFGFSVFGVGATYLGFMRETVLDSATSAELAACLSGLIRDYDGAACLTRSLAKKLEGEREFYVAYGGR